MERAIIIPVENSGKDSSSVERATGRSLRHPSFNVRDCENLRPTNHTATVLLDQSFRQALARQLIDGYSSRKRKGFPDSIQRKKCVVLDDWCFASEGNHIPKMVSNFRRYRKCRRKGQEKRTHYMCARAKNANLAGQRPRCLNVKVIDSCPACFEFKPCTSEDTPCRMAMHVKCVEAQTSFHKRDVKVRRERVAAQVSFASFNHVHKSAAKIPRVAKHSATLTFIHLLGWIEKNQFRGDKSHG
ncbi:hypothetical protein TNCV_2778921 [Trichonephila clavipes]|nr:hypothetical protein TNCV_2778921 [Trichonephila clavipes]